MIEEFAKFVPQPLLGASGSVFYSGRAAFGSTSPLYVLGLNPGGSPNLQADHTVARHMEKVIRDEPDDWSAYRDESWQNRPKGTSGMQPRVLHMMRSVGLGPGEVPASNLVFQRSSRENSLQGRFDEMADACWRFHDEVIARLRPRVILCFGATAGAYLRRRLRAETQVGEFVEQNNRRWCSRSFRGTGGVVVVVATHPSIADWTVRQTDPTGLVVEALHTGA